MRAFQYTSVGEAPAFEIAELPDPEPGPNQVRLRVAACGINQLDLLEGSGRARVPALPHIPGAEVAGEIDALGPGVVGVAVGDRVAVAPYLYEGACEWCQAGEEPLCLRGTIFGQGTPGGFAEFTLAPVSSLVAVPAGLDLVDAAALTLAAPTAWKMVVERAQVRPGETVLVVAAGGGVGSAAVQIAAAAGARVIAAAGGTAKLERARALGAWETIDYSLTPEFGAEVRRLTGKRGADVVIENPGATTWGQSLASLSRGGRLVTCGAHTGAEGAVDIWVLMAKQLSVMGSYGASRRHLSAVFAAAQRGTLKPVIDELVDLDGLGQAFERLRRRQVTGKLVCKPHA